MSRTSYGGPKLPKFMLDQVQGGNVSKRKDNFSRRDRRKAERQEKKSGRGRPTAPSERGRREPALDLEEEDEALGDNDDNVDSSPEPPPKKARKDAQPPKSILKKEKPAATPSESSDAESEEEEPAKPVVSRAIKDRLAGDDAEIAVLEKKLGLKGKKKSKALEEDGLDGLFDSGESGSEDEGHSAKRKRPEDTDWLQEKRRKANEAKAAKEKPKRQPEPVSDSEAEGEEDDEEAMENPFSEDELSDDDVDDDDEARENPFSEDELDSEDFGDGDDQPPARKPRENPYVAPVSKNVAPVAKYVPPSLRKPAASDEEAIRQLRRQIQGQLNRLSESNILSILKSMEEFYEKNARQHVTSTLVDLLVGLITDPSILNDTFLILHAGFATAVYKVVGMDFGAQLLEKVVEGLDHHHTNSGGDGKQSLNLLAFLSCLYTFQMVGSAIIFDYIGLLLSSLSENNTELLLRIIRTSGPQLRQDDPSALKDIVLLLQRSVAALGEANLSVRTKFMIETINNLKNNRMKTGLNASTLTAEHTTRMKKSLGAVNARPTKASEPLRISLADIRDTEKKGKWWLVGASYHDPAKLATNAASTTTSAAPADDQPADDPNAPNLPALARANGMNTPARRAIFTVLLTSADYLDAVGNLHKLHLKAKQTSEIARVLVHCVGSEAAYNPYYALVAGKFASVKGVKRGLEGGAMGALRGMGREGEEGVSGSDSEDEGDGKVEWSVKKVVNLGKFYGALLALGSVVGSDEKGGLTLTVLKRVEFALLPEKVGMFLEVLVTSLLLQVRKLRGRDGFEEGVGEVFARAKGAGGAVVQGLRAFVAGTMAKGELAGSKKEARTVREGCRVADVALEQAARDAPVVEDDEDEVEGSDDD